MLLTGASGFVGSHIIESLLKHKLETAVLLRPASRTNFLETYLPRLEVRRGSITDPTSLKSAINGVTHVIHCAGSTKALRVSELYEANHLGTRNLVEAVNAQAPEVKRFIHISSLAVSGPATAEKPATEDLPPKPVSEYGKSKLAGELAVKEGCRTDFTILRPSAVYGPRDKEFLPIFKAVKNHLLPRPNKEQALSLVYAEDLAEAVATCLVAPIAAGKTYFVASPEIVTGYSMSAEVARQMNRWTIPCPIPALVLWVVCLMRQALSSITRKASLLNLQKYAELTAPGWVCSSLKLQRETGVLCRTNLKQGIAQTLEWYTRHRWL